MAICGLLSPAEVEGGHSCKYSTQDVLTGTRIGRPGMCKQCTHKVTTECDHIPSRAAPVLASSECRAQAMGAANTCRTTRALLSWVDCHPNCHFQCDVLQVPFDLDAFLESARRTKKWLCPHCLRPAPIQEVWQDPYMTQVLAVIQGREDIEGIEVDEQGEGGRPSHTCTR